MSSVFTAACCHQQNMYKVLKRTKDKRVHIQRFLDAEPTMFAESRNQKINKLFSCFRAHVPVPMHGFMYCVKSFLWTPEYYYVICLLTSALENGYFLKNWKMNALMGKHRFCAKTLFIGLRIYGQLCFPV